MQTTPQPTIPIAAPFLSDEDKRRAAAFTAKLLRQLGVAGAVLGFAHGGHAVTDTALTAEACEGAGIAVATLMFEMAGEDGTDFGLVQRAPAAEPLVSTGNIPADIWRDWRTDDGRARLEVVPRGNVNDNATLRQFASAVLAAAPTAIGAPASCSNGSTYRSARLTSK